MQAAPRQDEDWMGELPPGFRFRPKTFELLGFLREKLEDGPVTSGDSIKEVDVYSSHPQTIIERYAPPGDKGCYVFSPTKRRNGRKADRSNGLGKWKTTVGEKKICSVDEDGHNVVLGYKSSMAYYDKNGDKTHWLMDEYFIKELRNCNNINVGSKRKRAGEETKVLDRWVVCFVHLSPVKGTYHVPVDLVDEADMGHLRGEEEPPHDHQPMLLTSTDEMPMLIAPLAQLPQPEARQLIPLESYEQLEPCLNPSFGASSVHGQLEAQVTSAPPEVPLDLIAPPTGRSLFHGVDDMRSSLELLVQHTLEPGVFATAAMAAPLDPVFMENQPSGFGYLQDAHEQLPRLPLLEQFASHVPLPNRDPLLSLLRPQALQLTCSEGYDQLWHSSFVDPTQAQVTSAPSGVPLDLIAPPMVSRLLGEDGMIRSLLELPIPPLLDPGDFAANYTVPLDPVFMEEGQSSRFGCLQDAQLQQPMFPMLLPGLEPTTLPDLLSYEDPSSWLNLGTDASFMNRMLPQEVSAPLGVPTDLTAPMSTSSSFLIGEGEMRSLLELPSVGNAYDQGAIARGVMPSSSMFMEDNQYFGYLTDAMAGGQEGSLQLSANTCTTPCIQIKGSTLHMGFCP